MYKSVDDNSTDSGYVPLYYHGPQAVSTAPVCVQYKVALDSGLRQVVSSGQAFTSSDIDYTVKVEAKGLFPFTRYYYQFNICGSDKKSTLGRTKTAPEVNQRIDKAGLAVYTCSNYPVSMSLVVSCKADFFSLAISTPLATQLARTVSTMSSISVTTSTSMLEMAIMVTVIPLTVYHNQSV